VSSLASSGGLVALHVRQVTIVAARCRRRAGVPCETGSIGKELREVRELIWELLAALLADRLPPTVRKELQNVVQLLQCYLRAAELEAREREREVLLSELMPAMEEQGYDAGTVKAVMGC
jgi:hypothetical protein